jgi:transcriptional regulator with XRE-family HTH domain
LEDLIVKSFGVVLRRLRQSKGLSQEVLGSRSRTQRKHISALELGNKQPSIGVVFKLAEALDITPGDLITLVDVEYQANSSAHEPADAKSAER